MPVKLRDGVTIYTNVFRPVDGGQVPVIVAWSPCGKTIPQKDVQSGVDPKDVTGLTKSEGPDAGFWVSQGYAVVNPDPRGAGKSQGDIHAWGSVDALSMALPGWPSHNGRNPPAHGCLLAG